MGFLVLSLALWWLAGTSTAKAVSVDPSNRYYRDGTNNPVFLIGYYGWAATPDGYFIDHPSRYATMIQRGGPYKLNYIRVSSCVNRFTSTTTPQSWNNQPTPVPFAYVSGKANLNQWDATFWTGLLNQCALAQQNGVIVHIAIFDGVEIRQQGGATPILFGIPATSRPASTPTQTSTTTAKSTMPASSIRPAISPTTPASAIIKGC